MLGLITGSGFYDIGDLVGRNEVTVETPFGGPVTITTGRWRDRPVCFLPRHGADHSIPPHAINYRANVSALKTVGATAVLATAVSGAINPALRPGDLVLISDYVDFTTGREVTFFDGTTRPLVVGEPPSPPVVHTDMTGAYDTNLRRLIRQAALDEGVELIDGAVYCATNGPRFETPAEIHMMGLAGGDLVGMTGYPEVALAREAGLRYASIGVVSNLAAGLSAEPLSAADIMALIDTVTEPLHRLLGRTVELADQPEIEGNHD